MQYRVPNTLCRVGGSVPVAVVDSEGTNAGSVSAEGRRNTSNANQLGVQWDSAPGTI